MKKFIIVSLVSLIVLPTITVNLDAKSITLDEKSADYDYIVYPEVGGIWEYGLDYHPPAKDTAFSEYYHADEYHGSTACVGANCTRIDSVAPGQTSVARAEEWGVSLSDCSFYYHLN